MRLMWLVATVALLGCDKPTSKESATAVDPVGRWIVVPAGGGPGSSSFFFTWRLDTVTGALELCFASLKAATGEDTIRCTASVSPTPN
jgi:hypothetical protein